MAEVTTSRFSPALTTKMRDGVVVFASPRGNPGRSSRPGAFSAATVHDVDRAVIKTVKTGGN